MYEINNLRIMLIEAMDTARALHEENHSDFEAGRYDAFKQALEILEILRGKE